MLTVNDRYRRILRHRVNRAITVGNNTTTYGYNVTTAIGSIDDASMYNDTLINFYSLVANGALVVDFTNNLGSAPGGMPTVIIIEVQGFSQPVSCTWNGSVWVGGPSVPLKDFLVANDGKSVNITISY